MLALILLALLNGAFIAVSRALNGRLSLSEGAFKASSWNHWVGFVGLSLLLAFSGFPTGADYTGVPAFAYLGGVIGALYVAINSHVLPRLGTLAATLLVISGQMLAGLVIDWGFAGEAMVSGRTITLQITGVSLLLLGIFLGQRRASQPADGCQSA